MFAGPSQEKRGTCDASGPAWIRLLRRPFVRRAPQKSDLVTSQRSHLLLGSRKSPPLHDSWSSVEATVWRQLVAGIGMLTDDQALPEVFHVKPTSVQRAARCSIAAVLDTTLVDVNHHHSGRRRTWSIQLRPRELLVMGGAARSIAQSHPRRLISAVSPHAQSTPARQAPVRAPSASRHVSRETHRLNHPLLNGGRSGEDRACHLPVQSRRPGHRMVRSLSSAVACETGSMGGAPPDPRPG